MYARRLKSGSQKWEYSKYLIRSNQWGISQFQSYSHTNSSREQLSRATPVRRFLSDLFFSPDCTGVHGKYNTVWRHKVLRFYSSEGDGRNANEGKHVPVKEITNIDKGIHSTHCDAHALLGEQDQKEWLRNEKLSVEIKNKESPFLSRRERFKNEYLRRVVPWEKITVSWETFPYYIDEHTKNLLVECAASHLKHNKFTASCGARLASSSGRIRLQSTPGTELYRERLVRTLARELQVPLLVLDSSILAPYDFSEDCATESELDDENVETEECTSDSEVEEESGAGNEEDCGSSKVKSENDDADVDVEASAEVLKKVIPYSPEDFEKRVSEESQNTESVNSWNVESPSHVKRPLKKGDRVKYVGPSVCVEADNRPLSSGQRGEVYQVYGDQVAVILDTIDSKAKDAQTVDKIADEAPKPLIYWIHNHFDPRETEIWIHVAAPNRSG